MDYENESKYLAQSMRNILNQGKRVTATIETSFLRLFSGDDALAVKNNYEAYEVSSGYVNSLHNNNLMTGTASRLSDVLVGKICGGVGIEGPDFDDDTELRKTQKNDINTYKQLFSPSRLTKLLKEAFGEAIDSGRGVIFLNHVNNKIQTRVFNCFRCSLQYDEYGMINEAKAFILCNKTREFEEWILTEHRYFRKGVPYQKYIVTKSTWENDRINKVTSLDKLENVPGNVRELYKAYPLYREQALDGFVSLGVYSIDNTLRNKKHKYSNVPESQFVNVQDLIIERDITETQKAGEQNIGRGRVLVPSFMNTQVPQLGTNPLGQNVVIGAGNKFLDKTIFTEYSGKPMDDSKPTNVQFDIRAEQWRTSIAGTVGDICTAFGISILDFDPRYLQAGQRTDDEINAMTDITAATVRDKRENNTEVINQMLNQIAVCLGVKTPVFIRWSMVTIMNPTKNEDLITKQLSNGTISRKTAIQRSNPDYTQEEVEEELKRIEDERQAVMPQIPFDEE